MQDIWDEAALLLAGNAGLYLPFSRCQLEQSWRTQMVPETTSVAGCGQSNEVMRKAAQAFLKEAATPQPQHTGCPSHADPTSLKQATDLDCLHF